MLELALEGIPFFSVSDFEMKREGNTYTAQTLELLKEEYPEDKFYFIIGADSLFQLETWYHPEKDDVIVTSSLNLIMDEVCRRLGVQHCICSVVDRQTLTVEYINFSANKVSAFRKCFGASAVPDAFYTDNAADLPMIHLSRTAYKVRHNRITRIK